MITDPIQCSCTCGAYWSVVPPEPCPYHSLTGHEWQSWPMSLEPEPMSDEEIERIARRVAELLRDYL